MNGVLDRIVIDRQRARASVAPQRRPARERMVDGLGHATASGDGSLGRQQPGVQVGQRRTGQRHALAGGDLLDPVEGQMVEIFAGCDSRQQADGGRRDQKAPSPSRTDGGRTADEYADAGNVSRTPENSALLLVRMDYGSS